MPYGAPARVSTLRDRLREIGAERLGERVAREHGTTLNEILGGTRLRRVAHARQHLAALLRWSTGLSFPEIGRAMGLDHSTVMHAVGEHEARINEEIAE